MPYRYYTDEGAVIRGEFDNSDNLQRPFDLLTPDGWVTKMELMPSPYHAVQATAEGVTEYAKERLHITGVDLAADPIAQPKQADEPEPENSDAGANRVRDDREPNGGA